MNKERKKRSQLEIVRDMLSTIQAKGGRIKPTHLLYKSNLSSKMLKEYVAFLEQRSLLVLEAVGGKQLYALTEKGFLFLAEYARLAEFAEGFTTGTQETPNWLENIPPL